MPKVKTSINVDPELIDQALQLKGFIGGRGPKISFVVEEALQQWVKLRQVANKGDSSQQDSVHSVNKDDRIHDQSAKSVRDWTDKELAAAQQIVKILRGSDELDIRTVSLLVEKASLNHGEPVLPNREHKRKRA